MTTLSGLTHPTPTCETARTSMTNHQMPVVMIFWDYDTQWGADRSRNTARTNDWGAREFPNTDRLLELHARYDVPACFAVVGAAALPGSHPYHDADQVRRIHSAGHEVASHSFRHEWLPGLGRNALRETLRSSKDALEQCIGVPVTTFVPPFNQPFDHAPRLSFSLSERIKARGDRTDVGRLCQTLSEVGYRFCRLAYRTLGERLRDLVRGHAVHEPIGLETIAGVRCVRLNTPCGFHDVSRTLIERNLDRAGCWVLYGHPHSATDDENPQSVRWVERTLAVLSDWRAAGRIRTVLPRDVDMEIRA